jgi:hypothetical protein
MPVLLKRPFFNKKGASMNGKNNEFLEKKSLAVFQHPLTQEMVFVMRNLIGGLCLYHRIKDRQSRFLLNKLYLKFVQNEMKIIKSPKSPYHVWHVCMCNDCMNVGGRIFSHSQGDWDSHLRFVEPDNVFDFESIV